MATKKTAAKPKPAPPKTANVPAKTKAAQPPAVMNFERDSGSGFENADRDSYAIPFLVILQKGSPQVDDANEAYLKAARPGMFFNTATQELYDGKEGVLLVPAAFQRSFVEWVPRENGGGFVGSLTPEQVDLDKLERDDAGRFTNERGNHLVDTRYHFCVHLTDEGPRFVIVSLSSTQIKKSRQWMTRMSTIKLEGDKGQYTPPTYSHVYRATTVDEKNEKGSWKGIKIDIDHMLTPDEAHVYAAARTFREQVVKGVARPQDPPSNASSKNDAEDNY